MDRVFIACVCYSDTLRLYFKAFYYNTQYLFFCLTSLYMHSESIIDDQDLNIRTFVMLGINSEYLFSHEI
jgi:hypothetical protein